VGLGIACGLYVLPPSRGPHSPSRVRTSGNAVIDTLTRWDGQWYLEIALQGYNYGPQRMSSVAFFPGYPLLIAMLALMAAYLAIYAALLVAGYFLI
jgi:hypothetical protein